MLFLVKMRSVVKQLSRSQNFYNDRWLTLTFDPVTFSITSVSCGLVISFILFIKYLYSFKRYKDEKTDSQTHRQTDARRELNASGTYRRPTHNKNRSKTFLIDFRFQAFQYLIA